MVAWSLLRRWDEELAYSIRAARESYMLKEGWKKIAKGHVANLPAEYEILYEYQKRAAEAVMTFAAMLKLTTL